MVDTIRAHQPVMARLLVGSEGTRKVVEIVEGFELYYVASSMTFAPSVQLGGDDSIVEAGKCGIEVIKAWTAQYPCPAKSNFRILASTRWEGGVSYYGAAIHYLHCLGLPDHVTYQRKLGRMFDSWLKGYMNAKRTHIV